MKKMSKILSLVLSVVMILSTANITTLSVSAAETDTKIYFEFPTELWADAVPADGNLKRLRVYASTWAVAGDSEYQSATYQSIKEKCTYEGDGIFSYDPGAKLKTPMKEGADYAVIFSTTNGSSYQTCSIAMNYDCYGDTVVCTGESSENKDNSLLLEWRGVWKNNQNYDPELEIDAIYAVGNGCGKWLNDVIWDADAEENKMTEIANRVYRITFCGVEGSFEEYQCKFAANGDWTHCWGGNFVSSGKSFDAVYNASDNIVVDVPYKSADVTLTLDLIDFDYATKTGGKIIITVNESVEDTTATEPVETTTTTESVEDTTATEPVETTTTTETVEDTTVTETAESTTTTDPVEDPTAPTYVVAGSHELCGIFNDWDGDPVSSSENIMEYSDGVYTKVFPYVWPAEDLQVMVVENSADGSQNWIGYPEDYAINFNVDVGCAVTVTYNPVTGEITVTGDGVSLITDIEIDAMYVVGNGDKNKRWLNGVSWIYDAEVNKMTEISDKVYNIEFDHVIGNSDVYKCSFVANGTRRHEWGGYFTESGEAFDAIYEGDSIRFDIPYEFAHVSLTLDLSNFDYATKTGGKITITVTESIDDPANHTYVVAGSKGLCGVSQEGDPEYAPNNVMNLSNGVYTKVFTDVRPGGNIEIWIVDNQYGNQSWIGDATGNPFTFNVNKACDVTVTYDPKTDGITVTGDYVSFEKISITPTYVVAGSKKLCGVDWKSWPKDAPENVMTEVDGVYTKVFTDVAVGNRYAFRVVENVENGVYSSQNWIGSDEGNSVTFSVNITCDVTVTFNPATYEITVTGEGVSLFTDIDIDAMYAVGNGDYIGESSWLNGASWNPSAEKNKMTEISEKVYQITYTGVAGFSEEYRVTFAANGSWTDNWGGIYTESGKAFDSVYDGDDICFDVPYEIADVTLTLDLSDFNCVTKTGGKITITVTEAVEDTTTTEPVEDTTATEPVEDTTTTEPVEDTTATEPVEDTTATEPVEDTTTTDPVEDTTTTDPEESTDPVASDVYVVAGSEELCGVLWKGNAEEAPDNVMVETDGVYTKVFTDVQPAESLQFKVVKNNTYWIGDVADCNIEFNVVEACDVTITFDPATSKITVTGDGVSLILELEINAMHAAGSADDEEDTWLNGVFWDPSAEENKMTEIADRVYTITFEDVKGYSDYYQVRFAANGEWTHNWGGVYTESGKAFDAIYNGDNIVVDVPYEIADVTLTLDLSNFDYVTKAGGKITITVVDKTAKELIDGDVNCDGKFNIDDVAYLQMHLAYYKNEDGSALIDTSDIDMFNIADVNGDKNINILDATYMQLMLASLI